MNPAIPKSRIRGLEVFDQLLNLAPDGVAGNVGVYCPGEEKPFVEELIERVEFCWILGDFGRWERLEHVVDSFLETEEGVEDVSKVWEILIEDRFHCVGVARESLSDGCQEGIDSACGDHHFLRGVERTSELFLEVSAEGFFGGISERDSFIGFHQCGLPGSKNPGLQSTESRHLGYVTCLRHGLRFRGVIVLWRRAVCCGC